MGFLAPLASLLGIETEVLMQRARESATAFGAIALFALIGLVFLLVALYTSLVWWVGPLWAPLIIAAAALVIALVLVVIQRLQQAAARRRAEARRKEAETTALLAGAAMTALPELFRSSLVRNVGLPLALYAGFLFLAAPRKPKAPAED